MSSTEHFAAVAAVHRQRKREKRAYNKAMKEYTAACVELVEHCKVMPNGRLSHDTDVARRVREVQALKPGPLVLTEWSK